MTKAYSEADYAAIESALRETPRGRWFLDEFSRRARKAETEQLLSALSRFERALADQPAKPAAAPKSAPPSPANAPRAAAPKPAGPDPRLAAFARLEGLSFEERLALFG